MKRVANRRYTKTAKANSVPVTNSSGYVPIAVLASGTANATKFIRDDNTLVASIRLFKTADQTVANSTTLVNDSHITTSLEASTKYSFHGTLFCTTHPAASSGIKIDFGNSTATVTNFRASGMFILVTSSQEAQATTLTTSIGFNAAITRIDVSGSFEVNAAGTFGLRFAQLSETGSDESAILLRGSYLIIEEMD